VERGLHKKRLPVNPRHLSMAESHPISVLVIEDLQDTAESLAEYLRLAHGYRVRTASDGDKGIKLALAEPPDVVVSDIGPPAVDGIKVALLLSELLVPKPLFIAVTAYGGIFRQDEALQAFDHYLVKPAHPAAIAGLIQSHLAVNG
jgi:DNA-binding response OmpR family regulator